MALDNETIFFGILLFFLQAAVFFILLRISNKLMTGKLFSLGEKQNELEKLVKKFAEITAENKKEISELKKEIEKDEKKMQGIKHGLKDEIRIEKRIAEDAAEKALVMVKTK